MGDSLFWQPATIATLSFYCSITFIDFTLWLIKFSLSCLNFKQLRERTLLATKFEWVTKVTQERYRSLIFQSFHLFDPGRSDSEDRKIHRRFEKG